MASDAGRWVLDSRRDITLGLFEAVAWRGDRLGISEAAKARMAETRAQFLTLLEDPEVTIYGVTTGYGQMAKVRLSPEQRQAQAARRPVEPATAFGRPLPERVTRGIVLARLANFLDGHAAVSPELAVSVAAMLDGSLPEVSSEGIGSAGEIQPLSQLFAEFDHAPAFGPKEGLALVNGSPVASALLADAVLAGRRRLAQAEALFALSIEAILAPLGAFDPALGALWGDPHETRVLARFDHLLEGAAKERRPYQAPVSWRILPRVLGQAHRALAQAEEAAAMSLAAVSDNPVFLAPDAAHPRGRVESTGGYHNARAAPALDALAAAWAELAILADRQCSKLLDGHISLLPDNLLGGNVQDRPSSGYIGCLAMTAAAWSEAARRALKPSLILASEGGGFGQNDAAPATHFAWHQEAEAGRALENTLACLASIASQAFHVTGRDAPPRLQELLAMIREELPPLGESRVLGGEAGALAARLGALGLVEIQRELIHAAAV